MLSCEISQVILMLEYPKVDSMTLKVHFEHLKTGNLQVFLSERNFIMF